MTEDDLLRCCASRGWANAMARAGPGDVFEQAEQIWWALEPADWLEAFAAHPRIGGANAPEQAGMQSADPLTVEAIARANDEYFAKFGFIFIVCAAGKSGEEMLSLLQSRLHNTPEEELRIAAREQAKITRLRLQKAIAS